jgi:UDP-3-O-[3-hydroxymyristoyl] glucosamine N-acyltransferase
VSKSREERTYSLGEIAKHVGGELSGSSDVAIRGVAGLDEADADELTFLHHPKYRPALATTRAAAVLVAPGVECPDHLAAIRVDDPYVAVTRALFLFDPGLPEVVGVHPTAVVADDVEIGPEAGVGPHAVVEAGAVVGARTKIGAGSYVSTQAALGEDCYLFPRVFVGRGCILGNRVWVHPGAVIGADGFGYARAEGEYRKIPQIGIVEVGDDVEIGANACIDRATVGKTTLGRGTKIDNLVQIAHNVAVAEDAALAAQSGVAGSTRIGKGARLGGQAGLVGHITIGDGASIGAQAGVIGDVPAAVTVSGYPARPHGEAMRIEAAIRRLPELLRRIRALEKGAGKEREGRDAP